MLYNSTSGKEYEKISDCMKKWDKLEVTYECTNKVKKTIASLLVCEYELFQMKEGEYVESIFSNLRKIIG